MLLVSSSFKTQYLLSLVAAILIDIQKMVFQLIATIFNDIQKPVKTQREIRENSMLEEDVNGNFGGKQERWGPQSESAHKIDRLYTFERRMLEYIIGIVGVILLTINFYLIMTSVRSLNLTALIITIFQAYVLTDFLTAFIHWLCDTWGSLESPLIRMFLYTFRQHHIDPSSLTRQNFFQIFFITILFTLPLSGYILYKFWSLNEEQVQREFYWICFIFFLEIFLNAASQTHKWAHTYTDLPSWIEFLQEWHIILPRNHHRIHHVSPHETYFCLFAGWFDWPLDKLRVWKGLGKLVETTTGFKPREDDMKWARNEM